MTEHKLHEQGVTLRVVEDGEEFTYPDVIDFGPTFNGDGSFQEPFTVRVKTERHNMLLHEDPDEVTMVIDDA